MLDLIGHQQRKRVMRSFNRAAATYSEAANVQRIAGNKLFALAQRHVWNPECVIDLGCGPGLYARQLLHHYARAQILLCDIASNMLHVANKNKLSDRAHLLEADFDYLPCQSNSVSLIFANMSLQWSFNLNHTFSELTRVLMRRGKLILSMPVASSLYELSDCFTHCDKKRPTSHFYQDQEVLTALEKSGLCVHWHCLEKQVIWHREFRELIAGIKEVGASQMKNRRYMGLKSKSYLQHLNQVYDKYRSPQGMLPVTYYLLYAVVAKVKAG